MNNIKLENKNSVEYHASNKSNGHLHILKTLLKNHLISILPEKGHSLHKVASFHFKDFGKMLRGTTSLAIASAIELNEDAAINWALSVELMHNASLVLMTSVTRTRNEDITLLFLRTSEHLLLFASGIGSWQKVLSMLP